MFDIVFILAFLFVSLVLLSIVLFAIIQTRKSEEIIPFAVILAAILVLAFNALLSDILNAISIKSDTELMEIQLYTGKSLQFLKQDLKLIRRTQNRVILFGPTEKVVIQYKFLTPKDKQFVHDLFNISNFPNAEFQYPIF